MVTDEEDEEEGLVGVVIQLLRHVRRRLYRESKKRRVW